MPSGHYKRGPRGPRQAQEEAIRRFWSRVSKTETCWLWQGPKNKKGYGLLCQTSAIYKWVNEQLAHRIAYVLLIGPIPEGKILIHGCDTPGCVRLGIKHAHPGTNLENVQDAISKGSMNWRSDAQSLRVQQRYV